MSYAQRRKLETPIYDRVCRELRIWPPGRTTHVEPSNVETKLIATLPRLTKA